MIYGNLIGTHEKIDYSRSLFYFVKHTQQEKDNYTKKHWHNSIEITYVLKGSKVQTLDDCKITANKGDLTLVNSGIVHDVDEQHQFEGIVLLIERKSIDMLCPQCINRRFNVDLNLDAKRQIIEHMIELDKYNEENNRLKSQILVLEIIDLLVSQLMEEGYYYNEKKEDYLVVFQVA